MRKIFLLPLLLLGVTISYSKVAEPNFVPKEKIVNEKLLEICNDEKESTIETLKNIVNIESFSSDHEGLVELSNYLAEQLKKLGGNVEQLKPANNANGLNVVGKFKGTGTKNILLMAHMDTVYPKGSLKEAPWKQEGDKVYGPGVADAKSGVATILHTVSVLNKMNFKNYKTLTVLFNTDEEIGSHGSRELITNESNASNLILSYEPTLAGREFLILNTSGTGKVKVTVNGLSAHAGAAPEEGINALVEAANFVEKTVSLDEGAGGTRFNWTVFESGNTENLNVIPDTATIYADIRFLTEDKLKEALNILNEKAKETKIKNSEIIVEYIDGNRPPFNTNEKGMKLLQNATDIYHSLGEKLHILPSTGGGTDAGYTMESGNPAMEGMALAGNNAHVLGQEFVDTTSIPRRLYLSAHTIIDACDTNIID
ncbi:MAG: glutamate carboxypeptidase [Cetobacterium sp.]